MATDIRSLDPDTPDYDAQVEAALREEDLADGLVPPEQAPESAGAETGEEGAEQGQEAVAEGQAPDAAAAEAAPVTTEPQSKVEGQDGGEAKAEGADAKTEPKKPAPVAGVLGKDGQVLPHSVLKAAREEAKQNRLAKQAAEAETKTLRERLAALGEHGDTTRDLRERAEEGLLTPEEREDFPALAKIEAALAKLSKAEPAAQADKPAADERSIEDEVQDAIDSVPLLASWQAVEPEKWRRALKHDEILETSPKWKDRPLQERFAHVAKLVAAEYDEQASLTPPPPPSSKSTPAQARQDPKKAIEQATRTAPNTLSDFKGGAPDSRADPIERLPAMRQVAKFSEMSDADIDAYLARQG